MKVLVSQSGMKHSLGLMRHLRRAGHMVTGISSGEGWRNRARWSWYTSETVVANQKCGAAWLAEMKLLLKDREHPIYIPVGFPVNEYASRFTEELRPLCGLAVPSLEAFELARDKLKMAETALRLGVGTPHTLGVKSRNEATKLAATLNYPAVIKGRFETGGQRILAVVHSPGEFTTEYQRLCDTFCLGDHELPIIQEFIPGTGWGFFAFYQNGKCRRVFMHRRVREIPATGGCSTCAESVNDPALEAAGRRLLDDLNWNGVAMAEFRRDSRDGSYKLMEINPKFWGSLELALASGADFADDYVRAACGEELPERTSSDYRCGVRYSWPFDGDILHGMERPAHLFSVFRDMLNPFVKKNAWLRDPLPLVHSMLMCGRQIARKLFGKPSE